jgi:sugar/nucleoside kinase (ribokinase family)
MKRVLVAGEINVDLILHGAHALPVPGKETLVDDLVMTLGSASAICAVGLARLGTPVAFLGKVGADTWGDYCLATMQGAGVDVSRVVRDGALKTGVTVSISSPRDRALVSFLGSIRALTAEDVGTDALRGFDHLHVSSYYLQQGLRPGCRALFARARAAGLSTSLDPGFDPSERWERDILDTLREADLFFPNEVELLAITGQSDTVEALRHLRNGHTRTVAKLGAQGCVTLDDDGRPLRVAAFAVSAVDTTGAGDSFDAGFLHRSLAGGSLLDSLRWGAACGALSTRALGGTGNQADRGEAERLVASVS